MKHYPLVGCFLALLFFVHSGYAQSQEYPVGVTYIAATDYSRTEKLTPQYDDYRDILIKIWYPAAIESDQSTSYLHFHTEEFPYSTTTPSSEDLQFHAYLKTLPFKTFKNVPMAQTDTPFPVVLYSHGYQSTIEDKEILMIELAKRGYIVASVGHPHHAGFVTQSLGKSATYDSDARANDFYISDQADVNFDELVAELLQLAGRPLNDSEIARVYQLMKWTEGDRLALKLWVQDMHFALDQLTRLQYGHYWGINYLGDHLSSFKGQFDLTKLAAVGLSFGGPTVAAFCEQVYQCKAAVNLDGIHYNLAPTVPQSKPYLMMHSDTPLSADFPIVFNQQKADTYMMTIDGALHWDFSDLPYILPNDRGQGLLGTIDPYLVTEIVNTASLEFIDLYIKGNSTRANYLSTLASFEPIQLQSKTGENHEN
ncbi:alpha/beta hydrolase family protein [Pseudoalteromonas luteoviolacea]|uniref:alpha/beta hydrolase family protein n=1 Tax=Pseudoalteromonas luteoviolacea TaxID=43657 RepID=UPI001151F144|nr:hypothetical protein [Pseudoalteromonas luteoviolacea]TQF72075.1 hypothetical protein FLM44_13905 [Pseudoalteromonas luteoviolacea]